MYIFDMDLKCQVLYVCLSVCLFTFCALCHQAPGEVRGGVGSLVVRFCLVGCVYVDLCPSVLLSSSDILRTMQFRKLPGCEHCRLVTMGMNPCYQYFDIWHVQNIL